MLPLGIDCVVSFPGRMRNSLASSNSYFCCQKVGITNYISECCHMTIVNPQWRRKQIVSVEATSCRAMDNIVRVLDYPWLREVRRKFVVSFCGGGDFFQKHAQVHSKIKLLFFQCYRVSCITNTTSSFLSDVASRRLLSRK